jgi:hypothetical protein
MLEMSVVEAILRMRQTAQKLQEDAKKLEDGLVDSVLNNQAQAGRLIPERKGAWILTAYPQAVVFADPQQLAEIGHAIWSPQFECFSFYDRNGERMTQSEDWFVVKCDLERLALV